MTPHILGVRHHGPGCARSVRIALEEIKPDIVLVEGPPDADSLLPMVLEEGMRPPVAILVYRPDQPQRAVFYPMAVFSPEWQAVRFSVERAIPVRFFDLPQSIQLADPEDSAHEQDHGEAERAPDDPLGDLGRAAGYPDFELWWEEEIERRTDPTDLFAAILDAMEAMREVSPAPGGWAARREAWMRQSIQRARDGGFERVAVVCGAWHAPALARPFSREDRDLLQGLEQVKVEAVWIPWTNFRLSYRSGYGAGITSPGWYEHLWERPERATFNWIARGAQLMRAERLHAPTSGVIDAARLGDALAALRDRRAPGLDEMREAIRATLCQGDDAPLRLIREQLEVGYVMGCVPAGALVVPLQRDLESQQRRLRLTVNDAPRDLDLDLRRDIDLKRSHLLHRLNLLDVPWGALQQVRGKAGTFHEVWRLQWEPHFTIALIDKAVWGNTVVDAAGRYVADRTIGETDLPLLASLLQAAILAELPQATGPLLHAVRLQAAAAPAVQQLMQAVPTLAQVARYGDVRRTETEQVLPVVEGLLARIFVELRLACRGLDADGARAMLNDLSQVGESVRLLDRPDLHAAWREVVRQLMLDGRVDALLRGWAAQVLLDAGAIEGAELQRLAGLALSPVTPSEEAAAWIEGVLQGAATLLLQQAGLWTALDGWLCGLDGQSFDTSLPLLRRAFSTFGEAERRAMGETVRRLGTAHGSPSSRAAGEGDLQVDRERAARVLPVLAEILGTMHDG